MTALKETVKSALGNFGLHVRYAKKQLRDMYPDYEMVIPYGTYSPWNRDQAFTSIYQRVKHATLVDKYRCFELWRLVGEAAKLGRGAFVEIGVWRGGTTALIAAHAKKLGLTDAVFACDTFTGVVKAGESDAFYYGGEHADTSQKAVEALLYDELKLDNVKILTGVFPDDTGRFVDDLEFRFCHIDVDVYQSAKDIVDWLWERMVPGGIIVYDDYGAFTCPGIARYVDEQLALTDRIVLHNLNGHAVVIKR